MQFNKNPSVFTSEGWSGWLIQLKGLISHAGSPSHEQISQQMKRFNAKHSLREWFVVPAYDEAASGNYALTRQLKDIVTPPYAEQSK